MPGPTPASRRGLSAPVAVLALLTSLVLPACGGGGGGGGGGTGGGGGPAPADQVAFQGFTFRSANGVESDTPPVEDGSVFPPSVGAPLDLVVVFHFDGVPAGPFDQGTLRVYTTADDINPDAQPPAGVNTIQAKGTYHLVVDELAALHTVEFRPFVPTKPLEIKLTADPAAVPGLLPSTTYTVKVSTQAGSKITNLQGPGGQVQFGTTANPAAFYPNDPVGGGAPALVSSEPADGAGDFSPNPFSASALDSLSDTFPAGPDEILLAYNKPLQPAASNIQGIDQDGDGVVDPTFFLRTRATALIVGHRVPASVLFPGHGPFPALSALDLGAGSDPGGDDIVLFGGDGVFIPASLAMPSVPSALASGRDAGLLFVAYARAGQTDLFTMADNWLGDPLMAALATATPGGAPAVLDTGLDALVGLVQLLDGRLVGFDNGTRRVVELAPVFSRAPANVLGALPGPPLLTGLTTGAGGAPGLFLGAQWPAGVEVLDLAQAPSGALVALVRMAVGALPSLVRVVPIDPDTNGVFGAGEGGPGALIQALGDEYAAIEFLDNDTLAALNRTTDSIEGLPLTGGAPTILVSDVGGFGQPSGEPDGLSPARTLAFGHMELDVGIELLTNDAAGSTLRLTPLGLLPVGRELTVFQRNSLSSLAGVSEVNTDPADPQAPLGSIAILALTTASPLAGDAAPIDDVFLEDFVDTDYEDASPVSTNPLAEWAKPQSVGGIGDGGLRASSGVSLSAQLGDFRPLALGSFKPGVAWVRADPPWIGQHDKDDHPEFALDMSQANYQVILLDTDSQNFPLPGGATPGINTATTVIGGHFVFRDFVIPEGVRVIVRGSNPLRITATGRVEIHGMLDVRGTDGLSDDTFDSAFLAVPGGPGGPGAGRGGDAHPIRFDPKGTGAIDQFVTPERGETGYGVAFTTNGTTLFLPIGGQGGLSTVGYDPNAEGYPAKQLQAQPAGPVPNNEHHRIPGAGGGSFYFRGQYAHEGTGAYLVQSESSWFPFTKCNFDDTKRDALYGNDENVAAQTPPNSTHTQCVYLVGTLADPERFKPGGLPGSLVFADGDPANDFIGPGGELEVLIGGQGGGGGGSRVDSIAHHLWSVDFEGSPLPIPLAPPYYPTLAVGAVRYAPSLFDAKGGAGGGGGGAVQIRCFGDIVIGRTGHIDARGGHGGGGEVVQNSNIGGGGGGGSGGAILLQAGGAIDIQAQTGHSAASYTDKNNLNGASLEVSGGFGRESQTDTPSQNYDFQKYTYDFTRSDGGQGGFGLIQLQAGGGPGALNVADGAFLFAKLRAVMKKGPWTGHAATLQREHPDYFAADPPPNVLRYIEMLHYREFLHEANLEDFYMVLNGSFPPLINSVDGNNGPYPQNTWPEGSTARWGDTKMVANAATGGQWVVQEPQPAKIMKTYAGFNPATFAENIVGPQNIPGTAFAAGDLIPLSIYLEEPDGTPFYATDEAGQPIIEDGLPVFEPSNLVDRLPVVPTAITPPPIGTNSLGRSEWLDFNGAALRPRSIVSGRTPPFFDAFRGTHNVGIGPVPAGTDGRVKLGGAVPFPGIPGRYVVDAEKGLVPGTPQGSGNPPNPPLNDVKVDAPDPGVGLEDVVTDNAHVVVRFQGAYAVRPGSHVPDPATLSPWVADVTTLSGFPLVRFEVLFDLGVDEATFPFGPDTLRPMVDYLRLRATY